MRHNSEALDRFKQPHLLHGDLWLFNILIQRQPAGPQITGILDADRAGWGDPLADWTMFVLAKSASPETAPLHRQFWSGYGSIEELPGLEFRKAIYEALHIGTALAWAARHHDEQTLTRGRADLRALAARLPDL